MARTTAILRKWTGFIASIICAICCGILLSFNVYAVQVKEKFDLTQTEVGQLGASSSAGLTVVIVGYYIVEKYGYRACYLVALVLVTSSGILMWVSTLYVSFFKECVLLMCLFQCINTAGAALAELCCIGIGVTLFGQNRIGLVSGLYFAAVSFGKIYYSAIYQIFFKTTENLGGFFLCVTVGLMTTIPICCILHRPGEITVEKLDTSDKSQEKSELSPILDEEDQKGLSVLHILRSSFFHLFIWPNAFFAGATFSFMNNITLIAKSLEMKNPDMIVIFLCVGIIFFRIAFGALFDCLGSIMAGIGILLACYVSFGASMSIGLFYLNDVSIFVMTALASIGVGAGFSLTIGILSFKFGPKKFGFILSFVEVVVTISSGVTQILIGVLYDDMADQVNPSTIFCKECFFWAYAYFIGQSVVCLVFGLGTMYHIKNI